MIEFKCSQCGEDMEVPQSLAGETEHCPKCKTPNRVPTSLHLAHPEWFHARLVDKKKTPNADQPNQDGNAERCSILSDKDETATKEPTPHGDALRRVPSRNQDHPYARKLAAQWLPDSRPTCLSCGKTFPLIGLSGEPSIVCPFCGYVPCEAVCREAVEKSAKMAAANAAQPAETETPPDARNDPPGLDDVIGNAAAVLQIRTALDAHKSRLAPLDGRTAEAKSVTFPSTLFFGPPGCGKTTLARIIARELKRPIRLSTGQALNSPARVCELLLSLKAGDVLFVEEIQGLRGPCQEAFFLALEDGIVVPVTRGGKGVSAPIRLPPFTLVAATTDKSKLLNPLLQRFGYIVRLERLSSDDLFGALIQRAERTGLSLDAKAAGMIADRAHGTPRLALRLLKYCEDVARASGGVEITEAIVTRACEVHRIDRLGLDSDARKYLSCLEHASNPVRLNVLASQTDVPQRTLETDTEPDLVFLGLISKTEAGRVLTPAGREHLKEKP